MISDSQIYNARILIIDDQKLHSFFLEKVLNQDGYRNIKCLNEALEARKTTLEFKPDLIILDLIMPDLDGFQVMEQLREFRSEHYLPILVLSSEKNVEMRLRALKTGATDFSNKPYENIEILFRIRNMIVMRILHLEVEDQNKKLESKVQQRTKELKDTQLDIIRRLAQAAEFRDNDTGAHILRMSQYCAKLGEALGLSESECTLILHASPLHDVGKIGIPDSILLKPGRLTEEEIIIMKKHAGLGSQLLSGSDSPVMKMAQVIAATHHERWDGTGYPNQLKGDEIPFVGQISCVCDVFDALTSKRSYKAAWDVQKTVEELNKMKGTFFNPKVVDKFLEILPTIEMIRNINKD